MKERQRWQPEEDGLLRAYVKQYGAREWNLIGQRMGKPLHRDPKSCLERWKNYLKPGLKKGSLTPEEQSLVISLQRKYGNKWKKIAAEVPGRTAKRLGKWWEVFKEKQLKHASKSNSTSGIDNSPPISGPYDHILDTFAEKYVVPPRPRPDPVLTLAPVSVPAPVPPQPSASIPPWMSPAAPISALAQQLRKAEEGRLSWVGHRKEAAWRLSRLEQQIEAEKARKRREKAEELEAEIRRLREETAASLAGVEAECRDRLVAVRREAEGEELRLVEALSAKHARLVALVQRLGSACLADS